MSASPSSCDAQVLLLQEALAYIPKLIELCDRNQLNKTYGSFDRAYWHYRTIDFPSGMYQEAVLPLALAYIVKHPLNPYAGNKRIKELVIAGIEFSARSSHADGSCDDYFPYERAVGAASFSLYACTESYSLLDLDNDEMRDFFIRRGTYLMKEGFNESGSLSNHKALVVLTLHNVYLITQNTQFKDAATHLLQKLLELQSPEGWFPEYEGADPGYLMFTIDFLAKYYQKTKLASLQEPLKRALHFLSYFVHPDGTVGGEYGSRNTFHALLHGLQIVQEFSKDASSISERLLEALRTQSRSYIDDDRIFIHYVYNYFQAFVDYSDRRSESSSSSLSGKINQYFPLAGLYVTAAPPRYVVISTKKAGAIKSFHNKTLRFTGAGLVGQTENGMIFHSQSYQDYLSEKFADGLHLEGRMTQHKEITFNPITFLCFRLYLLLFGRFMPANWTRKILQKKAILKKSKFVPIRFRLSYIGLPPASLHIECWLEDRQLQIQKLYFSSDATFIYIATSQSYQPGSLVPWIDLTPYISELNNQKYVKVQIPIT